MNNDFRSSILAFHFAFVSRLSLAVSVNQPKKITVGNSHMVEGWNEKIRVALTDTRSEKRTGVNGFTGPVHYFRKWNPQIHPSRSLSLRLRGLRLADLLGMNPDSWGWTHSGGICCVFATAKPNISKSAGAHLKQATRKRGQDYPLPRVRMINQDYKLMLIMWSLSNLCGQPLMFLKKYLFTVRPVPKLSLTSEFLFRIVFIPTEEEPCWSITVLQ